MPWIVETLLIVGVVLAIVGVLQAFVGRQYVIPSSSMEPTLYGCEGCTNDRILTEKISYYGSDPEPGDVIVFEGTESWNTGWDSPRSDNEFLAGVQEALSYVSLAPPNENNLVKRVVATGGQTVQCQEGDPAVMVDGSPIDQSYVRKTRRPIQLTQPPVLKPVAVSTSAQSPSQMTICSSWAITALTRLTPARIHTMSTKALFLWTMSAAR